MPSRATRRPAVRFAGCGSAVRHSTAVLLLAAALAGCGSESERPEVTFATGGQERAVGPAQYCDVQLTTCEDDQGAQAALPVPAGTAVDIEVPGEVSEAPWHVVFAYTGADGQRVDGRSPIFAPGSTERYTLTLPGPADRLETAQVQVFGPAPVQNAQTGEIEFPTRGTWLLVNNAPGIG